MAACFTTEEVLEQLFNDDNEDDDGNEDEEILAEEESEADRLREHLQKFQNSKEGFDREFFVAKSVQALLPILGHASSEMQSDASHLLSSTISVASILQQESMLWLKLIYRRFSGRVSVRQPYRAEVRRNIPLAVLEEITLLLRRSNSPEFKEPLCFHGKNKKGEVISFTSLASIQRLFQLLTGMSLKEVKKYFSRVLKCPTRNGHLSKLIVSDTKDFGFVYKYSTGQLTMQFSYGEWNTYNHPQHPCQMEDQEH